MIIRPLLASESDFLTEMLHEALFVPPGADPFPETILKDPGISKYIEKWGKTGDYALVAEDHGTLVGAIWVRFFTQENPGYGYISNEFPELTIAVKPGVRGAGIGNKLMYGLLDWSKKQNIKGISLSVDKRNRAYHWYNRLGFKVVKSEDNPTMLLKLDA